MLKNKIKKELEKKNIQKKNKFFVIVQVFILMIAIISFSYVVGAINTFAEGETPPRAETPNLPVNPPSSTSQPTKNGLDTASSYLTNYLAGKGITGVEKLVRKALRGNQEAINGIVEAGKGTVSAPELTAEVIKAKELPTGAGKFLKGLTTSPGKEGGLTGANYVMGTVASAIVGSAIAIVVYRVILGDCDGKLCSRNKNNAGLGTLAIGTIGATAIVLAVGAAAIVALPVAIVVTAIVLLVKHKNFSQDTFTYETGLWQPQDGGEKCDQCNNLRYGCSEYQCKTFGRACDLVNKGTTQEACVWINRGDREPPLLTPMESVLETGYKYTPSQAVSPPEKGVQIFYNANAKGCIPAFTGVTLGVETNELAECKLDVERKANFSDMVGQFKEGNSLTREHTLEIPNSANPSLEAAENSNLSIENGIDHQFYILCKDANGNTNPFTFLMEFCVDKSPDTKAPTIIGTNYLQESYFAYNLTTIPLEVYTDEPAICKWDERDIGYTDMQNKLTKCSQNLGDYLIPTLFTYGCSGNLTGLKDRTTNDFYIRCIDKPWISGNNSLQGKQYENQESYKLTLTGTQPLIIEEITLNEKDNGVKIKDSTQNIKIKINVETSAGANNGAARCQYKSGNFFYDFFNDGSLDYSNQNKQDLHLNAGNYNISIQCFDEGGNLATDYAVFEIETDQTPPLIVRANYDTNKLRITTDEKADCVYTTNTNIGCNYVFDDGDKMSKVGDTSHYGTWESNKNYYVKCRDEFGNQPALQNECSIEVRAFEKK